MEAPAQGKILGIFPRRKPKIVAPIVRADPSPEEMAPFSTILTPSALYNLIDPKSLDALEKLGGIEGVLEGLGTDRKTGLVDRAGEDGKGGRNVKIADRERVYGANRTPERKGKSLLQLAWMAYQDKVLVSTAFFEALIDAADTILQRRLSSQSLLSSPSLWVCTKIWVPLRLPMPLLVVQTIFVWSPRYVSALFCFRLR